MSNIHNWQLYPAVTFCLPNKYKKGYFTVHCNKSTGDVPRTVLVFLCPDLPGTMWKQDGKETSSTSGLAVLAICFYHFHPT